MENKINKLTRWVKGLFRKDYINLHLLNQLKKSGITPVFIFTELNDTSKSSKLNSKGYPNNFVNSVIYI